MAMFKYALIVYWSSEDDAYVVEVPELPGCMADGPTPADAVTNAQGAITSWVQAAREFGRAVPEPKDRYPLSA